jgi:hypothetical protein
MFREMLRALPLVVLTTLMANSGCSLMVAFDENKRPCGNDLNGDRLGDCLEGYSCQINQCVADASVVRGRTCTVSAQCMDGDVCAVPGFVCRQPCAWVFGGGNQCDSGTVCVAATDFYSAPLAACVDTSPPLGCATTCASSANAPLACVQVQPNQGRCMTACTLSCSGSGCSDGCDGYFTDDIERSCQPVGPNQNLVCLPSSTAASPPGQGEPCNFLNRPCDKGFACIVPTTGPEGVCRSYCQVGGDTRCSLFGATCQRVTTPAAETFGICN